MSEPMFVRIYLDHPRVGCGMRRAAVVRVGPKWVRLVYYDGTAISISRREYEEAKPVPCPIRKGYVRKMFGQIALPTEDVKAAKALARAA